VSYEAELGKPFTEAIRQQRLVLPRCEQCGQFHWYPLRLCPHCQADRIGWPDVAPHGVVYTFTTVRHPFSPGDKGRVPYNVALIELPAAPGVRLISELIVRSGGAFQIGTPVSAVFDAAGKHPRVLFTPSDASPDAEGRPVGDSP